MLNRKPFILADAISWWTNAGTNNHLGGNFNLSLYLSLGQIRSKDPWIREKQNNHLKISHTIYPSA